MNDSMNVAGNKINEPNAIVPRNRSKFPALAYHLYNTERFGEYNSCFVMDCVEGDNVSLRSGGSVQTYTLKAPLMQSVQKKKDFYTVPMMAILPFNWDKFYANPTIGDDVSDDVGTGVKNFWSFVGNGMSQLLTQCHGIITDTSSSVPSILTSILRCIVTMEYFYSNGNLIRSLGCSGSRYFHYKHVYNGTEQTRSFDKWFDEVMNLFQTICPWFKFVDGDGNIKVCVQTDEGFRDSYPCVNFHDMLQYFRDDLNCYVDTAVGSVPSSVTQSVLSTNLADLFDPSSTRYVKVFDKLEVDYNLNRLWAYQLVCSHYYSNDHVDYIYSAELYRQLIKYCIYSCSYTARFTYNGVQFEYDYLCAYYFNKFISKFQTASSSFDYLTVDNTFNRAFRGYFSLLFSYRRSLRFVDYFTGARTRPLAVGDVNVDVQSGTPNFVNVVDVTRNIQRQRFFNAVNRFGRKIEEYTKGLTGVSMAPDYHNPLYLAHTNDTVYGQQTENTGADQLTKSQSVTTRLISNGNRYQFEFSIDRPSVVIGISYYDINRAYSYNCERPLFHMNRFDMFNPFMQFIGDQPVYFAELGCKRQLNYIGNFGYQLRHMEYKQRYNQLAGGFIENLPGFAFSNDADDGRGNTGVQSSDFIHSLNGELDNFYVSLTGYSLGSYFHFIVDNNNDCVGSRQMAYAPSIL